MADGLDLEIAGYPSSQGVPSTKRVGPPPLRRARAGMACLRHVAGQTLLRLEVDGDGSADDQMKINADVTADREGWLL